MRQRRSWFGGAITQTLDLYPTGYWEDRWTGPGGTLVIVSDPDNIDWTAIETLTRPDGTTASYKHNREGSDYRHLPELMGEYWEEYQSPPVGLTL